MRSLTRLFDAVRQLARNTGRSPCYVCEVELGTLADKEEAASLRFCRTLTPDYAEHLRSVEHAIRTLH